MTTKIVIVDDDESIVFMLKEALSGEGYDVREGYDGQMAMQLVAEFQPNLVILDFNMPGISGREALDQIRANPATQNLPVMFLTGDPPEKCLPKGGDAITACLTKPISLDEFSAEVAKMVKGR